MANENEQKKGGASIVTRESPAVAGRSSLLAGAKAVGAPPEESETEAPPPKGEPVFRSTVEAGDGNVWVLPIKTDHNVRIGSDKDGEPRFYSFEERKKTKVPRKIIPHLERCNIIAPSIH